ncbi:MAG TPA: hypothetical protein VHZ24_21945 [Pirellulales bacterium]|jgi:hypothetical protein|nr:hypothetical protein [Pirellulales bacterium]
MTRFIIGYALLLFAAWCAVQVDVQLAAPHPDLWSVAGYAYAILSTSISGISLVRQFKPPLRYAAPRPAAADAPARPQAMLLDA